MPPPLPLDDLPPALSHTLQHIVGKLDMMTQVIGMIEERLSLNEDKMGALQQHVTELVDERLKAHDASVAHAIGRVKAEAAPRRVTLDSSVEGA